jgi:hypothetical protein
MFDLILLAQDMTQSGCCEHCYEPHFVADYEAYPDPMSDYQITWLNIHHIEGRNVQFNGKGYKTQSV